MGRKHSVLGQRQFVRRELLDAVNRDGHLSAIERLDPASLAEIPDGKVEVLLRTAEHLLDVQGAESARLGVAAARDVEEREDGVKQPLVGGAAIAGRLLV